MEILTHTIAAVSTPPGKGGVAVIRVSGDCALNIAESIFSPLGKRGIAEAPPRTQIYGYIKDHGEVIDDVLLSYFPAPHSYTGEDVIEISCHGGTVVTRTVLEVLLSEGARHAEAGEFTRRAFLNGRLSLSEAEAISSLLEAQSREQIRLVSKPARGLLGSKLSELRATLVDTMSSIYARIDYPDEDLGELSDADVSERLTHASDMAERLLSTYKTGRAIAEGIDTVICGKPNVGKSSLYNLLVGEDAAIVTDIEGTTRDVLTRSVPLGRVLLKIADTAGIRDGDTLDAVERIGIEKSRKMIAKCELLFALFDTSRPFDAEDKRLINEIRDADCTKIAVFNKSDLPDSFDRSLIDLSFDAELTLSAKDGGLSALTELSSVVEGLFTDEKISIGEDAVISSARQYAALSRARDFIALAKESLALGFGQDAASSDIERAIGAISEIDGRAVSEEIVADIFSKFCVGK